MSKKREAIEKAIPIVPISIPETRKSNHMDVEDEDQPNLNQYQIMTPGEPIPVEPGFLRGHGTYQVTGTGKTSSADDVILRSSVSGVVERVNKLVTVKPFKARYQPEVGDVVIGRITEVAQGRWKVDINAKCDAQLLLSSVYLPGGVQRKRTYTDELNMRTLLQESDVISAEIQVIGSNDGLPFLHTRSTRYGKLLQGTLVEVPSSLIKRCKSHFCQCDFGVTFIFGVNGFIWIYPSEVDEFIKKFNESSKRNGGGGGDDDDDPTLTPDMLPPVSAEVRTRIARLKNSIVALAANGVAIYPDTVLAAYSAAEKSEIPVTEILKPEISVLLASNAREVSQI